MATTDILPFATGGGANVETQAAYAADATTATGFVAGTAVSAKVNKVLRQSAFIAAGLANLCVAQGVSVPDDGNLANLVAELTTAFQAVISGSPAIRKRLTANTTFFVSPSGLDTNNGLTAGTPWLTIQHAANVIQQTYDLAGFNATIQLANGTYSPGVTACVVSGPFVGAVGPGSVVISGNLASPSSVVVSVVGTSSVCFQGQQAQYCVQGMKLQTSGAGSVCINAVASGLIVVSGPMEFGACGGAHMQASSCATLSVTTANYTISGSAVAHLSSINCGNLLVGGSTAVTLTGSPNFSQAFATAGISATINMNFTGYTFSGAASGSRFIANSNSVISTAGGGANYFPGNAAGTTNTGGQYV